jgi:hypothetical protein
MLIGMRFMGVYHQNTLITIIHRCYYCIGGPIFIVDDAYGLTCTRRVRINIRYRAYSDESLVESYTHYSRGQSILDNIKPTNKMRDSENQHYAGTTNKLFILYYNHLRR